MLGQKWKKSYIVPAMMALFHFSCRYHLRVSRIFFDENFLSTRVLTKARRSRLESCRDNNQGRKSDPFFWIARVTIINPLLGLYYNSGTFFMYWEESIVVWAKFLVNCCGGIIDWKTHFCLHRADDRSKNVNQQ